MELIRFRWHAGNIELKITHIISDVTIMSPAGFGTKKHYVTLR